MDVLLTIVDATAAQMIAALPGYVKVYRRKRAQVLQDDKIPCVVVAPAAEGEQVLWEAFGRVVVYGYPVVVVLVGKANALEPAAVDELGPDTVPENEIKDHMALREIVRNNLYQPTLAGAPTVYDCTIAPLPPIEVVGGAQGLYAVSGATVVYHSKEARAA